MYCTVVLQWAKAALTFFFLAKWASCGVGTNSHRISGFSIVMYGHGGWCLLCRRYKHRQVLMAQQIAQQSVTPGQCLPPSLGPAQKFRGFPKHFALAFVHPQVMTDLSSPCQAPNSPSLLWQEMYLRALPLWEQSGVLSTLGWPPMQRDLWVRVSLGGPKALRKLYSRSRIILWHHAPYYRQVFETSVPSLLSYISAYYYFCPVISWKANYFLRKRNHWIKAWAHHWCLLKLNADLSLTANLVKTFHFYSCSPHLICHIDYLWYQGVMER